MRILFDMDGVLVDVSGSFRRAVIETTAELSGRTVTPGEVQAYKDRGGFNNDWVLVHALVQEAGADVPYDEVVDAFNRRYRGDEWDGLIASEPPLIRTETLERLAAEGELGLVTGRQEAEAQWTLDRFGWDPFFPVVIGMETQGGREKPDPYGLVVALERLGERDGTPLDSGRAVYVGDMVDDMRAARAAGLRAVGVIPPGLGVNAHRRTLTAAGAEVVIEDVNVLPEVIEELEHVRRET